MRVFKPSNFLARRRSYDEIAAEIIRTAMNGARKTRIMYGSSLNLKQLNRYLQLLVEQGLLSFDRYRKIYRATESGLDYVKKFEEFIKTWETFYERGRALRSLFTPKLERVTTSALLSDKVK